MAVIVYSKKSWKSGKLLGRVLQIPAMLPRKLRSVPDLMVRWGCGARIRETSDVEIQSANSIRLAVNKRLALDALREEGVPIPIHGNMYELIDKFPVYVRTNYHTKGEGLWFCNNEEGVGKAFRNGGSHWLEAITGPRTEYRVHIGKIGDEYHILYRQRKFHPDKETVRQDRVRNFKNGWRFSSIPRINRPTARAARAAVVALGLDFGAVDVIRRESGEVYVLEVNTAPALIFRGTIMAYVRYFEELLGIEADPANVENIIQKMERKGD